MHKRRLIAVFYAGQGTFLTKHIQLSDIPNEDYGDITVDSSNNLWYYKKGTPSEQCYTIGTGVRVPDSEPWGPMMIYESNNPEHVAAVNLAEAELLSGDLRPCIA